MSTNDLAAVQTRQGASADGNAEPAKTQRTAGRWFSDNGCLLFIEHQGYSDDSDVQPLRDAVLLDEHDDLLRCADSWLAQAHDWRPVDSTESMPHLQVTLRTLSEPSRHVSLVLSPLVEGDVQGNSRSNADLRVALPSEWGPFVAISYQQHCASLVLDTVTLGSGDAERLTSGALVVLPASFEPQWSVRLGTFEPGQSLFLNARLHTDTRLLEVAPSAYELASWQSSDNASRKEVSGEVAVAPSAQQDLLVVLQTAVFVNTQACEDAWQSGASVQLGPLDEISRLRVRLSMQPPAQSDSLLNQMSWSGTLLRVGRGFGVIIESDPTVDGDC